MIDMVPTILDLDLLRLPEPLGVERVGQAFPSPEPHRDGVPGPFAGGRSDIVSS